MILDDSENLNINKAKLEGGDGMLMDLHQDSETSESDVGLPDDFPVG